LTAERCHQPQEIAVNGKTEKNQTRARLPAYVLRGEGAAQCSTSSVLRIRVAAHDPSATLAIVSYQRKLQIEYCAGRKRRHLQIGPQNSN